MRGKELELPGGGNPNAEFENEYYLEVNRAREQVFDTIVPRIIEQLRLTTAVDVGAGVGYFTRYLSEKGLRVTAVDGRAENIEVLRRYYPDAAALVGDAEELHHLNLGAFDLVFCAGLLYHLENPFRAIRNLHGLCRAVCVIESRVHWAAEPIALCIRETSATSQALHGFALLPSRRCLVNMLYGAGFQQVYSVHTASMHSELNRSLFRLPRRHFLVASQQSLAESGLAHLVLEPKTDSADMDTATPYRASLRRFMRAGRDMIPWLFQSRRG